MAESGQSAPTEQVRQAPQPRLVPLAMLAVAGFVAVALLKPWATAPPSWVAGPTTSASRSPSPTAAPSPTIDLELQATLYRRQCQSGAGWRVVSMEHNGEVRSRTLWPIDPAPAPTVAGALSAQHRLWTERVEGIGFCTPGQTIEERVRHVPEVSLWQRNQAGGLAQLEVGPIVDSALAAVGEVYWAPPARFGGEWPAGQYLFRVAASGDGARVGWFALEVAT
jgi:hypothetical protein